MIREINVTLHPVQSRRALRSFSAPLLLSSLLLAGFTALTPLPALADGAIKPTAPTQHIPDFANLTAEVRPAVVSVTNKLKQTPAPQMAPMLPFGFTFPQQRQAVEARGSGFIISADGIIVTNNHVVKDEASITVTLDDGTILPAKVIGTDPRTDLAILRVSAPHPLPYLQLGDSDQIRVGEWVIAVGNPFGLGGTVTAGILSARGRDIGDGPYDSFLQIDAPINQGNSGGPLFNQDGQVVGVNSAIISPSGGSVGIGFAIPSNTVKTVVAQLLKSGKVTRGYLGVEAQTITPDMARALNLPGGAAQKGALVAGVEPSSPAASAGVQPGDVITAVDGKPIASPRDLALSIASLPPGAGAHISLLRSGQPMNLTASLASLPDAAGTTPEAQDNGGTDAIGVQLSPITPDLRNQLGLSAHQSGVVISEVVPGSPADQAGLQAGDVIVSVGSSPVGNVDEAAKLIHAQRAKGNAVALRVLRGGQVSFVVVGGDDQG